MADLYLAMIIVRVTVPVVRRRLDLLSAGMLAIALVAAEIVAATAAIG